MKTPGSGAWLALLCSSRVLAVAWFVAYSAVLPLTQAAWALSAREAGLIQSAFWLHALTGLCQGGTYTPALALINDHIEQARAPAGASRGRRSD